MAKRISMAELRSRLTAAIALCADTIYTCDGSENPQTQALVVKATARRDAFGAVLAALNGDKSALIGVSQKVEPQQHSFRFSHFTSPWGTPNSTVLIAPGILRYDTPSHGGFQVSVENEALIPEVFRLGLWYEEDCACGIVMFFFPDAFPKIDRALVIKTLKCYYPDQWEAHTGETILPGESYKRDRAIAQTKSA